MNNNTFIREISETQSKYKVVKKNITQQSSYNLSVELENYLYKKGAIKKVTNLAKENDNNIYYELNDGVRIQFGHSLINIIGNEYLNINAKLLLVHTTNNNKFQIRRNDHNVDFKEMNWFRELYDKNFEGANFTITYNENSKILYIDNKIIPSKIISKIETNSSNEIDDYILTFKNYYLNNLDRFTRKESKYLYIREEFIKEYPIEYFKEMQIDDYVIGDGKKSGLCYELEFGKYKFAGPGIGGATANKYGFYLHNGNYVRGKEIIENIDEFWNSLREQIYSCIIEYGNSDESINLVEKYPLLKGMGMVLTKLLYIYYPNKFINICSKSSLRLLMRYFGYNFQKNMEADELSFVLNKNIREDIKEVNENDSRYLGTALWYFLKEVLENEEQEYEQEITEDIPYSKEDFLSKVFMSSKEYDVLYNLLMHKKNLILKGSPGVGKTYMAKRLAYSIMKKKADNQILSIQFHQSYSYEDFIEGIRPNLNGEFVYTSGVFKVFAERAMNDPNNNYFCIIDEINRGNLSKILGELMKLIEYDKRNVENVILPYSKEQFTVPSNLYIIGTMNTADRSLAMVDYALRRRFAFYDVKPAFNKPEFKNYLLKENKLSVQQIDYICNRINKLNNTIDEELGKGFEIGHSYFVDSLNSNDFEKKYEEIVEYEIKPLLEEYWFDDDNKVNEYKDML